MNAFANLCSLRWLLLFALALAYLAVLTADLSAADGSVAASSCLQANVVFRFVAGRAHMLQVSIVFVALSIAMLWWRR